MNSSTGAPPARADVVVVGAGGAGPAAAAAALENGAGSVVVLDKHTKPGGNAVFATGFYACESPVQRRMLVDVPRDQVFKQAMDFHHGAMVDARILRAYIDKSGDTIGWLMDKGLEFVIGTEFKMSHEQPATWHLPKKDTAKGRDYVRCGAVVDTLLAQVTARGSRVLLDTACEGLLLDETGAVTGAAARRGGARCEIRADAVILATGGFHGNQELMRRYFWFYDESFGGFRLPMNGDGIALAEQAGGAIEPYATLIKETCLSSDRPNERALSLATREPTVMWVNRLGRRFCDETAAIHLQTGSNPLVRQPGTVAYALFDEAMVRDVETNGWLVPRMPPQGTDRVIRQQLTRAAERGEYATIADEWDPIAKWIGADAATLRAEVEEYNAACARGRDPVFAKDRRYLSPLAQPPFYAVRFGPMIIDTAGPVRVNERMEVLDAEYRPVPGLYACGAVAAGWQGQDYCGQYLFGSALGFALNSGRIAGESAGARAGAA